MMKDESMEINNGGCHEEVFVFYHNPVSVSYMSDQLQYCSGNQT